MNVSRFKLGAVGALTVFLCGCASDNTLKTAGLLSVARGKDAALDASSATGAVSVAPDVEASLQKAQDLRKDGDFQGAAKLLSQLVLVLPDDPRGLGEYAKTLVGLGRSDDALAFAERAIELEPSDWTLYSARGVALDQKGDYRNAQMAYERALALKPGDPTVLSNAALSHMQAGDLAGAEKLLLEALQAGTEIPRITSNLALVRKLRGTNTQPPSATAAATTPTAAATTPAPAAAAAPSRSATAASAPGAERTTSAKTPALAAPAHRDEAAPAIASRLPGSNQTAAAPAAAEGSASVNSKTPARLGSAAASVERPKSDPAVRTQAVPKDPKAGPVVAKNAAEKKDSVPAQAAPSTEAPSLRPALLLRPALSEGRPPPQPAQQANAQN